MSLLFFSVFSHNPCFLFVCMQWRMEAVVIRTHTLTRRLDRTAAVAREVGRSRAFRVRVSPTPIMKPVLRCPIFRCQRDGKCTGMCNFRCVCVSFFLIACVDTLGFSVRVWKEFGIICFLYTTHITFSRVRTISGYFSILPLFFFQRSDKQNKSVLATYRCWSAILAST